MYDFHLQWHDPYSHRPKNAIGERAFGKGSAADLQQNYKLHDYGRI